MRSYMVFSMHRKVLFFKKSSIAFLLACLGSASLSTSVYAQPANTQASPVSQEKLVDEIVAVVNSDVITKRDIDLRLTELKKRLTAQGVALPPENQLRKQLLERIIVEDAQLQLAKESGMTVDDAMVDRALTQIAAQNQLSLPEFKTRLTQDGMDYAQFREEIRREITMQRVRERNVSQTVIVSDSEIDNYLKAQGASAVQGTQLHLAHILISVPENASATQIEQRRQRAEAIHQRLQQGEDFAKTAATYSDSNDALSGGDLGVRELGRLPQLFIDAVASLQSGQVSPVFKSANGFHILKLVNRTSSGDAVDAIPDMEQTHARHILIKVSKVVSADQAKHQLMSIKQRIQNHAATFEEMAKQYSQDGSAAQGGDLGWIYSGDTVPAFENAMNQLKPNEISDPVESPFGYHLIQVLERKTDDSSNDKKRQVVRRSIQERKMDEATDAWLRELRDSTYVEYRDPDYMPTNN